jgi:hypothetical protein
MSITSLVYAGGHQNAVERRREGTGMVTRVRIEAEGRSTGEVEEILYALTMGIGKVNLGSSADAVFGEEQKALADARAGEFVVERFAKDLDGGPNHGAIFFRGRMTTHFAPPQKTLDLRKRASNQ